MGRRKAAILNKACCCRWSAAISLSIAAGFALWQAARLTTEEVRDPRYLHEARGAVVTAGQREKRSPTRSAQLSLPLETTTNTSPRQTARSRTSQSPPQVVWEFCSGQFQTCECGGRMRWGTPEKFEVFEPKEAPWQCDFIALGDPAPGDNSKVCECEVLGARPREDLEWVFCASQFMLCECPGRIRWGNGKRWKILRHQRHQHLQSVKCTTDLGDPAPGDAGKHCECEVDPASDFVSRVSPAVRKHSASPKVTSCNIFESAKQGEAWDREQWKAVAGLCSGQALSLPEAGADAMSVQSLASMVDAWISEGFSNNYARLYRDGWLEEAFVNFIGSSPSQTKWALINEQLIRSVHLFSTRPIVVIHFGMVTPREWDPKKYPRLVVMHAAPFPTAVFRRFDLNKFRSLLIARVKTGIQLDSDQFVAPRVDELFRRAREEGSETYPMPILPVHFLKNEELPMYPGPQGGVTMSGGKSHVFDRYCRKGKCSVTTRWGHAHPTWTFWALPFVGTWLRRHLRDETLPAVAGPQTELRVTSIDVDEDLLNIGTWEERGQKQWCKYDVMDPSDFKILLHERVPPRSCNQPPPIGADAIFHPAGAALVFYTAHHAVDPNTSASLIDQLDHHFRSGKLPPPVFFKGCFYQDGAALQQAHPDVRCLI